jgi:hypothetical protein
MAIDSEFETKIGGRPISYEYEEYLKQELAETKQPFYERMCRFFGRFLKFELGKSLKESHERSIRIARMNITHEEIGGTLVITLFLWILLFIPLTIIFPSPLRFFIWGIPVFWVYYILSTPGFKAEVVKIQSSDAALRAILYIAMYLDMNPNLEGAIRTAAVNTSGPLGRDLKKLLWDLSMGRYLSMKEALGHYMPLWREWSNDFVKSLEFLINSVLRRGEERKMMIKKAQNYIIENTYNNMQQYARNLRGPVNLIHMFGIVLPIFGLIMFPLISIFLHCGNNASIGGCIDPWYLVAGYWVVNPSLLFFIIHRQIAKRPGAYSYPSIEHLSNLPPKDKIIFKLGNKETYLPLLPLALILGYIISIPGLMHLFYMLSGYIRFRGSKEDLLAFMESLYQDQILKRDVIMVMSLFWGIIVSLVVYFVGRSYKRKKIRDMLEEIENGIDLGLVELDNSLSRNIPIERALYDVIAEYEKIGEGKSAMHNFFLEVLRKIQQLGLTFADAVFSKVGAILHYPSLLLRNVMRVIVNSIPSGTRILVQNIRTVEEYIRNTQRVENLIKSILDEVIGSMRMLAGFISPLMCAMAASIGTFILKIFYGISRAIQEIEENFGISSGVIQGHKSLNEGAFLLLSSFDQQIPPTMTIIIVGVYLIEVILILSYFINGVEHGFDEINRDLTIGRYLFMAGVLFTVLVLVGVALLIPFLSAVSKPGA